MIGVFAYLTWRSAHNRISRQLRHLRSPRYLAALLLGVAYLWFMILGQRPTPWQQPIGRVAFVLPQPRLGGDPLARP